MGDLILAARRPQQQVSGAYTNRTGTWQHFTVNEQKTVHRSATLEFDFPNWIPREKFSTHTVHFSLPGAFGDILGFDPGHNICATLIHSGTRLSYKIQGADLIMSERGQMNVPAGEEGCCILKWHSYDLRLPVTFTGKFSGAHAYLWSGGALRNNVPAETPVTQKVLDTYGLNAGTTGFSLAGTIHIRGANEPNKEKYTHPII